MTAALTFVSSMKPGTAGTTYGGKLGIQMLSEPHLPGLTLAYNQAIGIVWSNHSLVKLKLYIYVYLSIPHRISLFIHLFDYLSWLSNGIESAPCSSSI